VLTIDTPTAVGARHAVLEALKGGEAWRAILGYLSCKNLLLLEDGEIRSFPFFLRHQEEKGLRKAPSLCSYAKVSVFISNSVT
jgi:hypothetical protein